MIQERRDHKKLQERKRVCCILWAQPQWLYSEMQYLRDNRAGNRRITLNRDKEGGILKTFLQKYFVGRPEQTIMTSALHA